MTNVFRWLRAMKERGTAKCDQDACSPARRAPERRTTIDKAAWAERLRAGLQMQIERQQQKGAAAAAHTNIRLGVMRLKCQAGRVAETSFAVVQIRVARAEADLWARALPEFNPPAPSERPFRRRRR